MKSVQIISYGDEAAILLDDELLKGLGNPKPGDVLDFLLMQDERKVLVSRVQPSPL